MAPDTGMTSEERACCRHMGGECGSMQMASSDSCCRKAPGSLQATALKTNASTLPRPAEFAEVFQLTEMLRVLTASHEGARHPEHSPPQPSRALPANLRI
ncbi:MAG: hypothetical protein NVSMB3_00550 [Acidobacteriaceae bacterium]